MSASGSDEKRTVGGNGEFLALGLALGAGLGAAFDNLAVGIAIGLAIGAGLDAKQRAGRSQDED